MAEVLAKGGHPGGSERPSDVMALRRTGIREVERYRFADLEVDAGAGTVKRGDQTLSLSPLSFDLLLALLRCAPQVLRRQDLLATVWPNEFVNDDTLSKRVRLLRDALGDSAEDPRYVASVRNWGYKLV